MARIHGTQERALREESAASEYATPKLKTGFENGKSRSTVIWIQSRGGHGRRDGRAASEAPSVDEEERA
jgi:hypothetical protein